MNKFVLKVFVILAIGMAELPSIFGSDPQYLTTTTTTTTNNPKQDWRPARIARGRNGKSQEEKKKTKKGMVGMGKKKC